MISVIDAGDRGDISARAGSRRGMQQQFDCGASTGAGEIECRNACLHEKPMGTLRSKLWKKSPPKGEAHARSDWMGKPTRRPKAVAFTT
jgi:hypothetical protein